MNYTKAILFIIFLTIALLFFSCEKSIEPEKIELSRRDYVWRVDTLDVGYGILTDIWASTSEDIWVGGPIDADENLWHYDGKTWRKREVPNSIGPEAIFGFSETDIWICGSNRAFWHFDGNYWTKTDEFEIEGYPWWSAVSIWGDSPDNIYMAGAKQDSNTVVYNLLMHYNGTKWQIVDLPKKKEVCMMYKRGTKESPNYYLWTYGEVVSGTDTARIYEVKEKKLREIYNEADIKGQGVYLQEIDNEIYFSIGNKIKKYNGEEFYDVIDVPFDKFTGAIFGVNKNDIVLLMLDGVAHYNGNDFKYIYNHEHNNIHVTGMMALEEAVLILAYDFTNGLTLVITGKLN